MHNEVYFMNDGTPEKMEVFSYQWYYHYQIVLTMLNAQRWRRGNNPRYTVQLSIAMNAIMEDAIEDIRSYFA